MAVYSAKLKEKSNVSYDGKMDIVFDILIDKEVKYPDVRLTCKTSEIRNFMRNAMVPIKEAIEQGEEIEIGTEVTL
jgi:hypothetical protein